MFRMHLKVFGSDLGYWLHSSWFENLKLATLDIWSKRPHIGDLMTPTDSKCTLGVVFIFDLCKWYSRLLSRCEVKNLNITDFSIVSAGKFFLHDRDGDVVHAFL